MAYFYYKLEFVYDDQTAADPSVFIQMRDNVPIYQSQISKEEYDVLASDLKNDFLTALFAIPGVVEVSTKAYRIWFMKSPIYNWEEVLPTMLAYLTAYFHYDSPQALPGSGNTDGTGLRLTSINNRRPI